MFHEYGDILPMDWTPIGDKGVLYRAEDLTMSYAMDCYMTWEADLLFRHPKYRSMGQDRLYPVWGVRWELQDIRNTVWFHAYKYEALVAVYEAIDKGRLQDYYV